MKKATKSAANKRLQPTATVCYLDEEIVGTELRERLVGLITTWLMLYIVYVMRGDVIRIISARTATREEREMYENK